MKWNKFDAGYLAGIASALIFAIMADAALKFPSAWWWVGFALALVIRIVGELLSDKIKQ